MSVATSLPESPATAGPKGPTGAELARPDEGLYEVVEGRIVEKPMGLRETRITGILDQRLGTFAETHRLGRVFPETLFRIDVPTDLQRRPDVAFVSDARWPFDRALPDVSVWDMVPDLAIEVVSPSNTFTQVLKKIREYFRAGVQQVWVVNPDVPEVYVYSSSKQIQVLQLGEDLDGGDLLLGFRLPLTAVFEKDKPEAE